ncbi:MAG: ABC transporter permease subunit [bacterium]|nr:ABC transporter permease subunit [bacterium]
MKSAAIVCRRELRATFESPLAYVLIVIFVLTQAALFYFIGYPVGQAPLPGLWDGGWASLLTLYTWLPLSLALLIPALTMGAWAEERRGGTEELLLTYPLRPWELVMGKFMASWSAVLMLILLLVVPTAITVMGLGELDIATVILGFLGAAGLAAAYTALALCCSALTSEQLVAFLVSCLVLGCLWMLRMLVGYLPASLAPLLEQASPQAHFLDTAARGVLDLRDVVYFVALTATGLVLNTVLLERRRLQ